MPTSTYVPLATITLGSTDTQILFSSIPATYRDLICVVSGTAVTTGVMQFIVNGNTTGYDRVAMGGTGSVTFSSVDTNQSSFRGGDMSTQRSTFIYQALDYSASDKHKTFLLRYDRPEGQVVAQAGRWPNTAVINSVQLQMENGSSFSIGTTFSLYGIAA
jgi:hypothetical protein